FDPKWCMNLPANCWFNLYLCRHLLRLIETASWGDDPAAIEQQLMSHQRFHSSIQRSVEFDRARDDLMKTGDKANLKALDQEWDNLQKKSHDRTQQLREFQQIIQEISKEIMWVNEKEEEELMFDWGDKNIDQYIPRKQESYSKLMSALEVKEKDLNRLKAKVDNLLKNDHPASDKIEAYSDTLQTQWSWLLQITKCIDTHLKENLAYSQFFKEANETYSALQKEHETVRKNFICDKNTSLETLQELLRNLEREKEKIVENRRQVKHLVSKSKEIVRLKPRNPEEKNTSGVIVKALCDFKQDQKVILKGNEAILKDNNQRSKWLVTGPGGLDMLVPSVCLIVPPPNPISISLANKNEQYYEAILSIWSQLYINVKSLISWQYCVMDIQRINSLTISMLAKMRPEEYRKMIKSMETHYDEFIVNSVNSQMFADEDKRSIENQVNDAQTHYEQLVTFIYFLKIEVIKVTKTDAGKRKVSTSSSSSSHSLLELHSLRLRLEAAEDMLSQHIHVCFGDNGVQDCSLKISQLETVQRDVDSMRAEYLLLKERILNELESVNDSDKAQFLRSEIGVINQRLGSLESSSSAYVQRLRALRDMLESVARAEDIVKVYEARMTEKETTSLSPEEVEEYMSTLKNIKAELDQKKGILNAMEAELSKASHWNGQVGGSSHRCDLMLTKYTEDVNMLSDRWRRIQLQLDTRMQDLRSYLPQLQHYKQTSTSILEWIEATRRKQVALQATKIENVQALEDLINNQKALNAEIKVRRETVDSVLKDNEACVNAIKDYETDLAAYTSGLETLLNIPVKRTMLKSPSVDLNHEATQLQTRYMELLTLSDDYYRFLGDLLRNMEELKIRNTRIDLLEEELRLLRDDMRDRNAKNKSLEDALAQYQRELNQSKEQLLSMEEVKQTASLQCSATKENLDNTQSQLAGLRDQVERLNYLLDEEKRKRKLAEERYTQQQEEYEAVLRKRQNELETVSWSKVEVEKTLSNKELEIEQLRRQLADETARFMELQKEISKVRSQYSTEINNLKLSYESQIHVSHADMQRLAAERDEDTVELQLQYDRMEAERRNLEEELRRLRISISQVEEQRKAADEEAHTQRAVIIEEGRKRRELESQVELLMRQRDEQSSQYRAELAEVRKDLQETSDRLAYVTHSLEEETRRRQTAEEGQGVLEQTLSQLQVKLTNSSVAVTQGREYKEELQKLRLELERESRERSRVEQNMRSLQGRIKDLQAVRDGLESQVENLRQANQEEVARRRQIESELEKTNMTLAEHSSTIVALRQSQEQASNSEKRGEEERLQLQEELEKSLRQNKTSAEHITQLSSDLKALQQQLLEEQLKVKEANLRNEGLYKSIEEKSKILNANSVELQRLKELTEAQTKERLRLDEELRTTRHEKDELLRAKQGSDDELSSQITALELQLQASERSNLDYRNLVSELSSEREKLKVETEKIQTQATEVHGSLSQYNEIVTERDTLLLKLQLSEKDKDHILRLEEELSRIKLSLESEYRNKQRLQEENERVKRDLSHWKDQCDSKHGLIRQYETDKDISEREKKSLKSEIERLMRELRELEESYKIKLSATQKELHEVTIRGLIDDNLCQPHTGLLLLPVTEKIDPSKLIFDGVRKPVTQLLDCGVLDKSTFDQLLKGKKTVPEVSVDKKVFLKGTGSIAGVAVGPSRKMSFTEAKKMKILSSDSADMLLEAQAATGHIIDLRTNQKLTVKEACARGVVDKEDESKLFAAEAAAIGYKDLTTGKLLSAGQAMKKGLIDKDTALRVLQAQESVGGILDPDLSIFLPKNIALNRNLIDQDLYHALSQGPDCYLDPDTKQGTPYVSLKKKCKADPSTGLLLLPEPKKPATVQGLRGQVSVVDLVDANLLQRSDIDKLNQGSLTSQEVEERLRSYLRGSTCIAGVYDQASDKVLTIYQAMKDGLLKSGTTLELLEAQAASGFIVDPVNNLYLTVSEAYNRRLFGPEFKDNLLAAERAVTGYRLPGTDKTISLFQAIEKGLVEKGHGIRLLEAQIASGGIIDPEHSHRIDVNVAYKRGYLDDGMIKILSDQNADTKGFFDPNTEENLTYTELKNRCIPDKKTGLMLLPIIDKKSQESTQKNTLRKRRVLIVDPDTNKEMTVREAYDKGLIDYETFLELSDQECEWEEVTITAPDGSVKFLINDKKTGRQYDITELLEKRLIDESVVAQYRARAITINEFADIITRKTKHSSSFGQPAALGTSSVKSSSSSSTTSRTPLGISSVTSSSTTTKTSSSSNLRTSEGSVPSLSTSSSRSSSLVSRPLSPTLAKMTTTKTTTVTERSASSVSQDSPDFHKHMSSVSFTLSSPVEIVGEQEPIGAIFDTDNVEKISVTEALNRDLVDSITTQRLLEAQACTGGIVDPASGRRVSIQEACRMGIITEDMATKLKPAQKAYIGFEDVKMKRKMSVPEAVKEMWLPYEAGQRFMEFQVVTGGLYDPEMGGRRTIEDALKMGWLDGRAGQKLQDTKYHTKNLTCPKSKLKISYKEALDNCLTEESTGVKMLQASSVSSRGISSPYNVASAPGSTTGSRSGSRRSSRRNSLDLGSPISSSVSRYSISSFNSFQTKS
uniref:Desmoplakin b n=1 Tax=Astatotilapia calliptera TaxID=8154 RepID=A0A3P8QZS9_ASTCA